MSVCIHDNDFECLCISLCVYAHMCVLERDASLSVFVSNVLYICVSMSEDVSIAYEDEGI